MIFLQIIGRDKEESRLSIVIENIKPDLIHTLETQHSGYLTANVKSKYFKDKTFPRWLHTNWGSDIYLFGRLKNHMNLVRNVLQECDYYSCESERDILLAKDFGFTGFCFPPFPNTGGFDLDLILNFSSIPTSRRKVIIVKGYQGWAGRALFALHALELAKESLTDYTIEIFSNPNGYDIKIASELFTQRTGIPVIILPFITDHSEMLKHFARSRVYIGLSISDAISTSLLESMATGAFPIQSDTSTADEWIQDGKSGFIVPAENTSYLADKIKIALNDDVLVDMAAKVNWKTIRVRADYNLLKEKTELMYDKIQQAIITKNI